MERRHVDNNSVLPGHDTLQTLRSLAVGEDYKAVSFSPSKAYASYYRMHKVLVGQSNYAHLGAIHDSLKNEELPECLDTAAWSALEAALVAENEPTNDRITLVESAEDCWSRAIQAREQHNNCPEFSYLTDDTAVFRSALNLAYCPMVKALILGNITEKVREQTFCDVLAIAQLAGVKRKLASDEGQQEAVGDFLGFEHECNAHLSLIFMNDPRYIPLPSTARGGSGYDYPSQTHDIQVINQHYGKILKVVPVEIKASASLRDVKRYDALIVRGKMHLAQPGYYSPENTRNAFANYYDGTANVKDNETVYRVTAMVKELLQLYQKGGRANEFDSTLRFHDRSEVAKVHKELSLKRD